jgi:hypothetical protein
MAVSDWLFAQPSFLAPCCWTSRLRLTLVMLTIFAARVALVWWVGLAFLQTRVMVVGDGALADAVTRFVEGPGRSHFRISKRFGTGVRPPPACPARSSAIFGSSRPTTTRRSP